MKKVKYFLYLITTAALCLFISGCGKTESKTITFNLVRPPGVADPQVTSRGPAFYILSSCMEGLVRLGRKPGEVIPGVAEKWEYSNGGKILTFHLRKNAKWSNGTPVTAHDFYNGIIRALEPITAGTMPNILYSIVNSEEFNLGKIKDPSKVGIKVLDDYTIQFILIKPTPYFIQILAIPTAFPLNEEFYKKTNGKYAQGKDNLLYNGPWIITKQVGESEFDFKKNSNYWNKDNIKLEKLKFILLEDLNTAANMYRNNSLDITMIGGDQLPLFKKDKGLIQKPGHIWYIVFNMRKKVFQNEKIRKAISMAINRKTLCESVRKDGSVPAYAFVPPGITDGTGSTFRKRFGNIILKENIVEARKLLKEGLKEIGHKGPLEISLTVENTSSVQNDGVYIQEELRKNLGIELKLVIKTYVARLNDYGTANYDMMYTRWGPDYNDPMTFMDLWIDGPNNRPDWINPTYDSYIKEAAGTNDNDVRMKAMAKAEKLLLKEMPIVPLYYTVDNWLVKPDIKDFEIRNAGVGVSFYWTYLDNK